MKQILSGMNHRERRLLLVAVPVALALVATIGFRALLAEREDARQRLARALEDVAWLQAQAPEVVGRALAHGAECMAMVSDMQAVAALAASWGVVLDGAPSLVDGRLHLDIRTGNGNQVIAVLKALACAGASLDDLRLETLNDAGDVRGSATLML